ncbi:hypothetical protein BU24DRAFT_420045, partial [Aaosphaeria arxii CBS 175.79]
DIHSMLPSQNVETEHELPDSGPPTSLSQECIQTVDFASQQDECANNGVSMAAQEDAASVCAGQVQSSFSTIPSDGPGVGRSCSAPNLKTNAGNSSNTSFMEGWPSSSTSLTPSPSTWSFQSVEHLSVRRPNPKLAHTRRHEGHEGHITTSQSSRDLNSNSTTSTPTHKRSAQLSDGTRLWTLMDTVPGLLGTRKHLEGLREMKKSKLSLVIPKDASGNDLFDRNAITDRDTSLLILMTLIEQFSLPPDATTERLVKPFNFTVNMLHCWRDTDSFPPMPVTITLSQLATQVRIWQHTNTYFPLPVEYTLLHARWADIIDTHLIPESIPIEFITRTIFNELIHPALKPEDLALRIQALQQKIASGDLPRCPPAPIKPPAHPVISRLRTHQTIEYKMPAPTHPNALYARRFSHKSPLGEVQDLELGHGGSKHDPWFDPSKSQQQGHKMHSVRKAIQDGRNKYRGKRCVLWFKWIGAVSVVLAIVGGLLLACSFNIGRKGNEVWGK